MKSAVIVMCGASALALSQAGAASAKESGADEAGAQQADAPAAKAESGDEQIVVTAERQAIQALGSTTITSEMLAELPRSTISPTSSAASPGSTSPAQAPPGPTATTGRSTFAGWGRKTP